MVPGRPRSSGVLAWTWPHDGGSSALCVKARATANRGGGVRRWPSKPRHDTEVSRIFDATHGNACCLEPVCGSSSCQRLELVRILNYGDKWAKEGIRLLLDFAPA